MSNRKQLIDFCRGCGKPRAEGERFSARGKCVGCSEGLLIANRRELRAHDGPAFEHWRRRCLAAFGIVLPPDAVELDAQPERAPLEPS